MSSAAPSPRRSLVVRLLLRAGYALLIVLLAFGGAVLVGLMPVNRDFRPAEQGIEIIVYADAAHSEIIVPIACSVFDWSPWFSASDFPHLSGDETHVSFGWGDREFFLHTPSWDAPRWDLTARSMFLPTNTVMHVELLKPPKRKEYRHVTIEPAAYLRMVEFIQSYFVVDGSPALGGVKPRLIPGWHYHENDSFYEAEGIYSLLYTCNAWTGDALEAAGVRTGCWTPFPLGILQLKE